MLKFGHPWLLLLLLVIPLYLIWEFVFQKKRRLYLPHSAKTATLSITQSSLPFFVSCFAFLHLVIFMYCGSATALGNKPGI